ncbi:MAG: tRNA (guanosine(37)-N1)-methyltransferase TrmD [Clostridia bacterium]|nr:tRNA (guanosine(37)-N1)-methyltransferase TrmD [Clostridia bacterium]
MNFTVMTLFPGLIEQVCAESIIGRAQSAGAISVSAVDIRSYSKDKHRRVDDTPYGGGKGMLMSAPCVYDCFADVASHLEGSVHTVYMSPQGSLLTQKKAKELQKYDNLVILCGHYEGIDSRVIEEIVDEEISIGDYVLTGGELPACVLIDSVARLCPGVLADAECYENESISCGMLEYPQYTRPYDFHGKKVPDVLLRGNHAEIEAWRKEEALKLTQKKRPDLL